MLRSLLDANVVPVVAPISLGPDGAYNVNADEAAGAIAAALEPPARERGEEALDRIEPGGGGRREVERPARMPAKPSADLGMFVSGVVVHDQMDIEIAGDIGLDLVEEAPELCGPMAREALANNVPGSDVEGGEQRGHAVTLVVVAAARRLAWTHGQHGLATVQRLDLRLLVDA